MSVREVEDAFSNTSRLLFGKALSPIDDYSSWLENRLGKRVCVKSALSGEKVCPREQLRFLRMVPKERIVSFEDGEGRASALKMEGVRRGSGLNELLGKAPGIAYFNLDKRFWTNANYEETMGMEGAVNCYRTHDAFESKNSAYCFYSKFSESTFGCFRVVSARHCIKSYKCLRVSSLFECDSVLDSSGAYFCHNCENVHDAMFCSNAKNLRYAVGNVPVGREKYVEMKKILLDYVLGKLEAKKSVELDIFNIGAL